MSSDNASFSLRQEAARVVTLGDAPWRWKAGIEAGLANWISLAAFTLAGYQAQGLIEEAVRARATVGEICDVLRSVWGEYRPSTVF